MTFYFTAKEWLQLVPFVASLGLVGYISYKEVNDYLHRREHAWVNKDYCKSKNKIADIISKDEINAAIDKNDKVAYCRCWKYKTVSDFYTFSSVYSLKSAQLEFPTDFRVAK